MLRTTIIILLFTETRIILKILIIQKDHKGLNYFKKMLKNYIYIYYGAIPS